MKDGWKYMTIGDLFSTIKNGANIKQIKGAKGIPITRIETLANGVFNSDRLGYAYIEDKNKYESYYLNDGDILMSHINSMEHVGRAVTYHNEIEGPLIHGMNLLRLVPIDVNSDYCVYYFKTQQFKKDILSITHKSVNQASFNTASLKLLTIPIPHLSEQQEIVTYLDTAFESIDRLKENAEKSLSDAKALFQSALKEMMQPKDGWEEKTIGYFADVVHGRNQKEVVDENGKYPIYGSGGNIMGYAREYLCDEGTTILGRKGTIDNPIYIESKFWNVDTAFGLVAKDNCNKKFLYYCIKMEDWAKRNTGTTLPSLTQAVVKNVPMCAPALSEQLAIVTTLDALSEKVSALEANYTKTIAECAALKQALLREVFE